jgi:hypothetical protein
MEDIIFSSNDHQDNNKRTVTGDNVIGSNSKLGSKPGFKFGSNCGTSHTKCRTPNQSDW